VGYGYDFPPYANGLRPPPPPPPAAQQVSFANPNPNVLNGCIGGHVPGA